MGKPKLEHKKSTSLKVSTKKCSTINELSEKKYQFSISDLLGMSGDILEKGSLNSRAKIGQRSWKDYRPKILSASQDG